MDFNDLHDRLAYYDQPRLGHIHRSENETTATTERIQRDELTSQFIDRTIDYPNDLPRRRRSEQLVGIGLIALWCAFLLWI